jgi:murein DD-endopeptidase MepM/ murein hydrolase activator NlpD
MLGVSGSRLRAFTRLVRWPLAIAAALCFTVTACSPVSSTIVFPISPKARAFPPGTWSQDQGVDITAPCGTHLVAAASGRIVGEGGFVMNGFGPYATRLLIDSGPLAGRTIYYGHVQKDYVRVGTHVTAGQVIADVGTLGLSYGCHVEIGISVPGSAAPAGWHQTSAEMLRLLDLSYLR